MNDFIKWQDVKNSMTAFSNEERTKIDLLADLVSIVIKKRQELGIFKGKLRNQKLH